MCMFTPTCTRLAYYSTLREEREEREKREASGGEGGEWRRVRQGRHGQCTHCDTEDTCFGTAAGGAAEDACAVLFVPPSPAHAPNVGEPARHAQPCTTRTHMHTCAYTRTGACADRHAGSLCLAARARPCTHLCRAERGRRLVHTHTHTHTYTHSYTETRTH